MNEPPVKEPLLLQVLRGATAPRAPVWLMRQAGRYLPDYRATRERAGSFRSLCYTPELAAEVTLQPIRRFGFDAAILFSDILVVPDALGQPFELQEGIGPVLDPIVDEAGIARLDPSRAMERLAPVFEAVRLIRSGVDANTALIGFCGAPWTVATYMVGGRGSPDQAAARLWAYHAPESFARLIDLLVETSAAYLCAQIEAGAQAIQIFDSWAGSLPESEFRRWSVAPVAELVQRVRQRHPETPVIGFPRGAGPLYTDFAQETGVDALACDTALPLGYIRDVLQPKVTVQGNLDPLALVAGGAALEDAVARIVEALSAGPFVFNLGHGILPQTPPEHVARLVELLRESRQG